jgi:hypothetical protein
MTEEKERIGTMLLEYPKEKQDNDVQEQEDVRNVVLVDEAKQQQLVVEFSTIT